MDGRIGHLHCRYRVIGSPGSAEAATTRLDRLARERVPEFLTDALDQALGEDPSVYVLRRIRSQMALNLAEEPSDVHLARRWAERLAGAAVRGIINAPRDGANLVRFANQADYVAHFSGDLLQGQAWRLWFYRPFAPLRAVRTADTLQAVLLDNRDHLPGILGYLHRYGTLEKILATLDEDTLRVLWSRGLDTDAGPIPEAVRPIFAGALRLVERLSLWRRSRPAAETLFQAYLATGPLPADWRDRQGLAAAVAAVLRFLADQGHLERPDDARDEGFASRLDRALDDFDWLDAGELRASVLDLPAGPVHRRPDLPLRPGGRGPTPRQRELLVDLAASLPGGQAGLDRSHPDSPANALRLYALLVAHAPRWADDALASGTVQRLLSAWKWLMQSRDRGTALRRLRRRDVAGALRTWAEDSQSRAAGALEFLAGLGEPGLSLVQALSGGGPGLGQVERALQTPPRGGRTRAAVALEADIETGCAGVFLLLRAILDARLPWLVEGADYVPPLYALLVALGLRWAGEPGLSNGQIDAGLGALAGLKSPPTLAALREVWSAIRLDDHGRFQVALLRILAGQRLVRGPVLHLYRLALGDSRTALVAGDETGSLWPLGRLVETTEAIAEVAAAWIDVWQEATGHRPAVAAAEPLVTALQGVPDVVAVPEVASSARHDADENLSLLPDHSPAASDMDCGPRRARENSHSIELAAVHRTGHEALLAALAALEYGRLGVPGVDLTIALTAIALLRVWARWLRQFATSSVSYLLTNLIRRPGRVSLQAGRILVEMEPRPLDIVIDMAGYMAELKQVPWLDQRCTRFRMRA